MELELNRRPSTGLTVTEALFGGNALFTHNDVGAGTTFDQALDQVGMNGLRYPGGMVSEAWGEAFYAAPDEKPAFAEAYHTFVGLDEFLRYAAREGQPVTLVLPTSHLLKGEAATAGAAARALDHDKVAQVAAFVADLLRRYPQVDFAGFEIGNEYWGNVTWMTSREYGAVANAVSIAVQAAMDRVLGARADQPAIYVQMGDIWGRDFDIGAYAGASMSWKERMDAANGDILDALTPGARAAIDGLIEHYYYNDPDAALTPGDVHGVADLNFLEIAHDFDAFKAAWGKGYGPLELVVTEWAPDFAVREQWGMAGASVLLEMMESLLRLGVGAAHFWPVEMDGTADLAGAHDGSDGAASDQLTPMGQAFRLMAEHTIGLELLDNGFDAADARIESVEINAFGSAERFVVFVSSRSETITELSLDVSDYVGGFRALSGERIYQPDPDAHWNEARWWAQTEVLSAAELGNSTTLNLVLDPYEIVMVEYALAQPAANVPTVGNDAGGIVTRGPAVSQLVLEQDAVLLAGAGFDEFIFRDYGRGTILGFDPTRDRINLDAFDVSRDALRLTAQRMEVAGQSRDGVLVSFDAGAVFLADIDLGALAQADFLA